MYLPMYLPGMNLTLDQLADSRPRYARLHAIRHGPLVLACIACREMRVEIPPTALLTMLTPLPYAARRQLRTLLRVVPRGAAPGV